MEQTLDVSIQNAKSLVNTIRLVLIIWSISAAFVTAVLGYWQHRINKNIETMTAKRDAEKARINNEEKLQIQKQLESAKEQYGALEDELQKTKQAQQSAEQKVQAEFERTHERLSRSKNPIVPRSLSPEQRDKFISILRTNPGVLNLASLFGDDESISFANELQPAIKLAGWKIKERTIGLLQSTPPPPGISIKTHDVNGIHIKLLQQAFKAVGFEVTITKIKDQRIDLIIGKQIR